MIKSDIEKFKPAIKELAEKYQLSLVVLFGSQVTGKTHSESDFDIAYYANRKVDFNDKIMINTMLTGILENINVQLVDIKTASPLLLKKIVNQAVVLYEVCPNLFDELYIYAQRVYAEAEPLFELREHYVTNKIKNYSHV